MIIQKIALLLTEQNTKMKILLYILLLIGVLSFFSYLFFMMLFLLIISFFSLALGLTILITSEPKCKKYKPYTFDQTYNQNAKQ